MTGIPVMPCDMPPPSRDAPGPVGRAAEVDFIREWLWLVENVYKCDWAIRLETLNTTCHKQVVTIRRP